MSKNTENNIGAMKASPYKARFSDAPWFNKANEDYALVLGAGGIGSNLIFLLSSIGVNMNIWDMDIVGTENIGQQNFKYTQIGNSKVDSIKSICIEFMGQDSHIDTNNEKYEASSPSNPIIFMGFDNMASRKLTYEKWVELLESIPEEERDEFFLIDGRLNFNQYQIFTVTKDNYKDYANTLVEDSDIPDQPCTMKATRFASWGIVSDMVGIYLNWCTNKVYEDDDVAVVPFKVEKSYPNMYYKIE